MSELAGQRLVPVGRHASAPLGYYFLRTQGSQAPASAQAFAEWLRRIVQGLEPAGSEA
jgi:hypothetical protein